MGRTTLALVISAVLLTASCQNATSPVRSPDSNEPFAPVEPGKLVVFVFWDGQGVPDKRVEVLELRLTGKTDEAGFATFDLPPGEYTLRAYDINRGGPASLYIDTIVTIEVGKEARVEILDCLPCV